MGMVACSFAESPPESRAVVEKYFEAIRDGHPRDTLELFSADAFAHTSKDEFVKLSDRVAAKLGPLKTYTVNVNNVTRFTGINGSGIYTIFVCDVQFAKYKAIASFRVFQPEGSKKALILDYNINSSGLVLE